jgi:hypothetical protein
MSRRIGGRPGDLIAGRPVNVVIQPIGLLPIDTSIIEVLRRPAEFALGPAVGVVDQSGAGSAGVDGHADGVEDQLGAEVVGHRPADDLAAKASRTTAR